MGAAIDNWTCIYHVGSTDALLSLFGDVSKPIGVLPTTKSLISKYTGSITGLNHQGGGQNPQRASITIYLPYLVLYIILSST
jgi:hypothetical protein